MLFNFTVFIHLTFKFSQFKPITSVLSNYGDIPLAYKLTALHKLSNTDATITFHKPK